MRQFLSKWAPVFLWAAAIFTVSSFSTLPKAEFIWWDFILKKSAHMIEYAILYFLVLRALKYKYWLPAIFACILYALSDEFHQSFVPGRTAKFTDVGFDTMGMLICRIITWRKS